MASGAVNMRSFNTGSMRVYADSRMMGNSNRLSDEHTKYPYGQESTSYITSGKSSSNGGGASERLAMNNVNYEQSYPIQQFKNQDKASKRKASLGDIPSAQPKQTCSTFRQPSTRKTGVIRIDARDYSGSVDSDVVVTAMTLPRAMNPLTNYSGTTTTVTQKQSTAPGYIQRNASKASSISHAVAMTTPPPTSTSTILNDLPPPPTFANAESAMPSVGRQHSGSNFSVHGAHDYTSAGVTRRCQPTFTTKEEVIPAYPSPYADTLLYQASTRNANNSAAVDTAQNAGGCYNKTFSSSSISASAKESGATNGQHVTFGPASTTDRKKLKKSSSLENKVPKSGVSLKTMDAVAFKHAEKVTINSGSNDEKKDNGRMKRKTLCALLSILLLLLLTAIVLLIYFATGYSNLKGKIDTDDGTRDGKSEISRVPPTTRFTTSPERTTKTTTTQTTKSVAKEETYCLTSNCIQAASAVMEKMNKSADPCVDFYEYSCGGWISGNYMPADKGNYGVVSEIAISNERLLYEALIRSDDDKALDLRGRNRNATLTEAEKKAKAFFKSCLNINYINRLGARPMLDMIASMGGWDALGNWDRDNWDFNDLLYVMQGEQSVSALFSLSIQSGEGDDEANILRLDVEGITIPDASFYVNDMLGSDPHPVVAAYKRLIKTILNLLGAVDVERVVDDVYSFEKQLAEVMTQVPSQESVVTIQELQGLCPKIKWYHLLQQIIKTKSLTPKTKVLVNSPIYMRNLSNLMEKNAMRTLHNYMVWRSVVNKVNYLSTPFRRAMIEFSSVLLGPVARERPLWRECMGKVVKHFELATGAMFVREGFGTGSKQKVEDMVKNIKNSFRSNLKNVQWMDKNTRKKATEKLDAMTVEVGYRDELLTDSRWLNGKYMFPIDENAYFKNILNSIKYLISQRVDASFNAPRTRSWNLSPQTMNAFYSSALNQVFFPAGLLQTPLFDPKFPMALNYGGIGSMIGHEITHGYDSLGEKFDAEGNFKPWWSTSTSKNYERRSQCLVNYYSKYSIGDLYVNGKTTKNENIADIAGLKVSYSAYRNLVAKAESEGKGVKRLPGLNLTDNQLFFVGYAQTWCMKRLPKSYLVQFRQDNHAPEKFRVLGVVSQYKEFAKAFDCPPRSPLNPERRCLVW